MGSRPDRSAPTPSPAGGWARQCPVSELEHAHVVRILGVGAVVSVTGTPAQRMAVIAGRRRGRIARRQLLDAGIGAGVVTRMLAAGRLHRLAAGVYAVGHPAAVELGEETAALLRCPDGAVLSHTSAAALWRIRPWTHGPVEITVLAGGSTPRRGITCHRTRSLPPTDIRTHQGLPVTSPARTLVDLACLLPTRDLERALDEALILKLVARDTVARTLARLPGRRGAATLAPLLDKRRPTARTKRQAEARFLTLIRAAGLPPPEVNTVLHGYEVDFLWRAHDVVVEIDGYTYHSTRSAFERDHRKDVVMRRAGLSVARFTRDQVMDEPFVVIADVARSLMPPSPGPGQAARAGGAAAR